MALNRLLYRVLFNVMFAVTCVHCTCTENEVTVCLAPLKEVDYDVSAAVVPFLEEDELNDHCQRYNTFETCMVDIKPYCTLTKRLVYQGIEDAYDWLCKDGFKEYLSHRDCFKDTNLHAEGERCNNTLTTSLENIKHSSQGVQYKAKRICQYIEQYLDCVETVIESFCNVDAAKWQRTMDEKSLEPLVSRIGCSFGGSYAKAHWVAITIGIMLTISIIIIVMAIVLVYMQRRKRRLTGGVTARQTVPGAPPPYDGPGPYMVYDGAAVNMAASAAAGVQQPAGPIPNKDPADAMQPPPYYPQDYSAQAQQAPTSGDDGVAAGYFGASATGVSVPDPKDNKAREAAAAEMARGDITDKETAPLPLYEEIDPSGYANPGYDDVEALGYFGTTPSTAPTKESH